MVLYPSPSLPRKRIPSMPVTSRMRSHRVKCRMLPMLKLPLLLLLAVSMHCQAMWMVTEEGTR